MVWTFWFRDWIKYAIIGVNNLTQKGDENDSFALVLWGILTRNLTLFLCPYQRPWLYKSVHTCGWRIAKYYFTSQKSNHEESRQTINSTSQSWLFFLISDHFLLYLFYNINLTFLRLGLFGGKNLYGLWSFILQGLKLLLAYNTLVDRFPLKYLVNHSALSEDFRSHCNDIWQERCSKR